MVTKIVYCPRLSDKGRSTRLQKISEYTYFPFPLYPAPVPPAHQKNTLLFQL